MAEVAASIATGSVSVLMLGLQPLILGALADEHRLSKGGIGAAATLELLALGLTAGVLAALVLPRRLRLVNGLASLALAACDVAGVAAQGTALVMSRAGAGAAAGTILWVTISTLTRTLRPDRLSGIFLIAQTLAQAGLAALLPLTVMARHGADGGLKALAATAVLSALLSALLPAALSRLPNAQVGSSPVPARALVGLAGVFLTLAGIIGVWVFVE